MERQNGGGAGVAWAGQWQASQWPDNQFEENLCARVQKPVAVGRR